MQQIFNNSKQNNYISPTLKGKILYLKNETVDAFLYYIFRVSSVDDEFDYPNITYYTEKCYMLYVPKNQACKCYIYDNYNKVIMSPNAELYELTFSEFVNTFRVFMQNDGKYPNELPAKIIQDI